jgi:hypothetical protein
MLQLHTRRVYLTYVYSSVYVNPDVLIHIRMYVHIHIYTYIHIYIYICINQIYTYIYIYIYIYIYEHQDLSLCEHTFKTAMDRVYDG